MTQINFKKFNLIIYQYQRLHYRYTIQILKLMKQQQYAQKNIQCHRIIRVIDLCENKLRSGDMLCHCIS